MRSAMGKQKRFIAIATPMKLMSTTPFDNQQKTFMQLHYIEINFLCLHNH